MNVEQYHTVQKAPETLILHLKRFEFDLEYMMPRKVNSYFAFPKILDITPLMSEGAEPPGLYELTGIVMHSGSAAGGHYWSHVKNEQTEKWYTFNDTMVYPVETFLFPENCFGGYETRAVSDPHTNQVTQQTVEKADSAYMLFYKRTTRNKAVKEPITLMSSSSVNYLLKEIEQIVIRDVTFSDGYLRFIDSLATIDTPCVNEFLVSFFFKTLEFTFLGQKIEQVASTVKDRTKMSQGFCDYILSNSDDIAKHLLTCTRPDMRNMCFNVIAEAITKGPAESVDRFLQTFLDQIPGCMEYSQNFDEFFKPILVYTERINRPRTDILLKLVEVIQECYSRQIAPNISAVLQAVLILIKSMNKQDEYRSMFLNSQFFIAFSRNEASAFDFASLLISFQDSKQVLIDYQQKMWTSQNQNTGKDSSAKVLASHFAATLAVEDEFTIDRLKWFYSIWRTKKWSHAQIADFLLEASSKLRSHKAVGSRVFLESAHWKSWLLSTDQFLRNGIAELIFAMFPSYPKLDASRIRTQQLQAQGTKTEQENISRLISQLFSMTDDLMNACTQVAANQNADLQMPAASYYDVLSWALSYASNAPTILVKHKTLILQSIIQFSSIKSHSRIHIYSLLDFIKFSFTEATARQVFDGAATKEVLNSLSKFPSQAADIERAFSAFGPILSSLDDASNDLIVNSGFFEAALVHRLYATSTLFQNLITKVVTAKNSVAVSKILFKKNVVTANFADYSEYYFELLKKLLAINNENVELFYKSECYNEIASILSQIFRKRLSIVESYYSRVILITDILQSFCAKFVKENKGKTVYFFFDKMGSFVSFWNSNIGFLINITEWIQMSSAPQEFVRLAIMLLECVLSCDDSFAHVFTADIYRALPKDFYVRLHSQLRPEWASMIARLCERHMGTNGEDVLAISLLDLQAPSTVINFRVFQPYFKFLLSAFNHKIVGNRDYIKKLLAVISNIINTTDDIRFFTGNVAKFLVSLERYKQSHVNLREKWITSCLRTVSSSLQGIECGSLSDEKAKFLADRLTAAKAFIDIMKSGAEYQPTGSLKGQIDEILPRINGKSPEKTELAKILVYFVNF